MRIIKIFLLALLLSFGIGRSFADTSAASASRQFKTIEKLGNDKKLVLHWGKSGKYYEIFKLDYHIQGKFAKSFSVKGSPILNAKHMLGAFVSDCAISECWKIQIIDFEKQTELEPILVKKYFEYTYHYAANWVGNMLELKPTTPGSENEIVTCDVRVDKCKRTIEHLDIPETEFIEWKSNRIRISRDKEVVLYWKGIRDSEYDGIKLDYYSNGIFKKSFDVKGDLNFNEEYSLGVVIPSCYGECSKIAIIDFEKLELDTIGFEESFHSLSVKWREGNFIVEAKNVLGNLITIFACNFRKKSCVQQTTPEKIE